jgi:hypothetical protein
MKKRYMKNPCWKGYKAYGTKMKNGKEVPNCVPITEELGKENEWGRPELTQKMLAVTPGQGKKLRSFEDFIDEPKLDTTHRHPEKEDASQGANPPALETQHRTIDLKKYEGNEAEYFHYEEAPAWQRKEGKNPEGGLNRKGIASYRRANPGSKLSLAVTTKPSKLKKGSKAANRRKSFCARMSGMKRRLTSAKTARDPDSRINKALRKWNC